MFRFLGPFYWVADFLRVIRKTEYVSKQFFGFGTKTISYVFSDDKNKITGAVRNRKTKFGSFQSVLKFKRTIEIDTNLESETEC